MATATIESMAEEALRRIEKEDAVLQVMRLNLKVMRQRLIYQHKETNNGNARENRRIDKAVC